MKYMVSEENSEEAADVEAKNIVLIGDGAVGKTSLLFAYQNESLLTSYTPTIFAKTSIRLTLDGRTYPINFHDTAGHEEFEKVRQVFYKTADAIVLCFSLAHRNSFVNVDYKWWRELQKPVCRRRVPIILVGTKSDLRESARSADLVTTGEGIQLCNRINAAAFLECSSSAPQSNIREVIYESVRAAVRFSRGPEQDQADGDSDGDNGAVDLCGQKKETTCSNLRSKRNLFRLWFGKCF